MEEKCNPVLTGREGGPIDLEKAASWTKNYRERNPGETISHFFGKEILENILKQPGCLGIRFYYAHDHEGRRHLVIAGAMSDGSDQINERHHEHHEHHNGTHAATTTGHILYEVGDQSTPCPGSPGCPKNVLSVGRL